MEVEADGAGSMVAPPSVASIPQGGVVCSGGPLELLSCARDLNKLVQPVAETNCMQNEVVTRASLAQSFISQLEGEGDHAGGCRCVHECPPDPQVALAYEDVPAPKTAAGLSNLLIGSCSGQAKHSLEWCVLNSNSGYAHQ